MATSNPIEVWGDVSCPFTHYSLRRFAERRELAGAHDVRLRVRAWPLELVNGEPLTAEKVGSEVPDIREQVAPDLFSGFDASRFPVGTIAILGAATLAYGAGVEIGEAFNLAVRNAIFEDGEPVADPSVLESIAQAHGLSLPSEAEARKAVEDDLAAGKERGVEGSPTFFVSSKPFFCPSLDIGHEGEKLRLKIDEKTMNEFLEAAFS